MNEYNYKETNQSSGWVPLCSSGVSPLPPNIRNVYTASTGYWCVLSS